MEHAERHHLLIDADGPTSESLVLRPLVTSITSAGQILPSYTASPFLVIVSLVAPTVWLHFRLSPRVHSGDVQSNSINPRLHLPTKSRDHHPLEDHPQLLKIHKQSF